MAIPRTKVDRVRHARRYKDKNPQHEVDHYFNRAKDARSATTADWVLNKAFIRGYQWFSADPQNNDIRRVAKKSWRKQITCNIMQPVERTVVAKLTAQEPRPVVTPATNTDKDRSVARACERMMTYQWRKHGMDREYVSWCSELWSTGLAWWKVSWNPEAGPIREVDPLIADSLGLSKAERSRPEGELEAFSVSPFEIFVDPGAKTMRDARFIIHAHTMSVDEVFERWGVEIQGERVAAFGLEWLSVLNEGRDQVADTVLVKELWELASKEHPGGRRIVIAGSELLEYEEPNPKKGEDAIEFPFIYCNFYPDTESFIGLTPVSQARDMQMATNQVYSLIIEQMHLAAHGKWLIPKGSQVTRITSAPGEKIEYNPTHGPPHWIRGDPVSNNMMQLGEYFRAGIMNTLGVQDPSLGLSEGASQSGRSILFAAEQDNTKLGPTLKCIRQALKELGRMMLETWKKNADFPLTYRIMGENAMHEAQALDANEINYEDVEFHIESSLPANREGRRQTIIEMAQIGLINQEKALKLLEFGDVGELLGGTDRDQERARHENDLLFQGEQAHVFPHEAHDEHLEIHLDAMKEDRWYKAGPNVQQAFLMHVQAHGQMMQGPVEDPDAGAPPPPGGPPPPDEGFGVPPQMPGEEPNVPETQALEIIGGPV